MEAEKTLIVGPWVGEFGWELFAWQGYMRSLAPNFDNIVVICRPTSTALYEDFATSFIEINPQAGIPDSFFMYDLNLNIFLQDILKNHKYLLTPDTTIVPPRRIGDPPRTHHTENMNIGNYSLKPQYIKYGKKTKSDIDYIFHMRARDLRPQDNWSLENWKILYDLLTANNKKVACMGTQSEAGIVEGAVDLRDAPLTEVFDVLRNATCAFGPSSGPMHLASLCMCPHIVWSKEDNRTRYEENWNPHEASVVFLSDYAWQPPAAYIYKQFVERKIK